MFEITGITAILDFLEHNMFYAVTKVSLLYKDRQGINWFLIHDSRQLMKKLFLDSLLRINESKKLFHDSLIRIT